MYGLFTVFVDNIPSSMDGKSLFKLFSKFGIIQDVFIPFKRRIVLNSRFDFVRFDYHVAADVTIQKANGLLVDDKFIRRSFDTNRSRGQVLPGGHRSFAEVLQGVTSIEVGKVRTTIKVNEEGHGWLYESAIIRFKIENSTHSIIKALKEKGLERIMVRKGGGRDDWSQFVVEWKSGFYLELERCEWLRCYGIPLNIWNRNTLNNIGSLWGSVFNLDGDICQPKSFSYQNQSDYFIYGVH
ncbi:hypothetical protein ACSBR1_015451 [Camellia fascicularis]